MKGYEKRSVVRFALIYSSAFFLLFLTLSSYYYYEKRSELVREAVVKQRIKYKDCQKFFDDNCEQYLKVPAINSDEIFFKIAVGFLVALVFIIPFSLLMGLFSLKPIREANSMMDDFISHIVHDLNTPLSVINLNVNSLIKRSEEKNLKKLGRIKSSAEQLEGMGHSLLAIVKNERAVVNRVTLDLKTIMEESVQSFALRFPKETLVIEGENFEIEADEVDLKRVVENIVSNAIKYNRENNPIEITLDAKTLTIKDNGIGMKEPEKVFDKYYREEKKIAGTGLGMSAVLAMCERNSIKIDLKSTLGEGTTVLLHFE